MDIYELLKKDHQDVRNLLEEINSCLEEKDFDEAENAFEKIRIELTAHSKAEEEVFYQPLKIVSEDIKGEKLDWEGEQEHHLIALLLNELSRMDVKDEDWESKVTVLREMLEYHIEKEEGDIFTTAKECFSEQEAQEIADNMQELKEKYKERIDSALAEDIAILLHPLKRPSQGSEAAHPGG